MGRKPSPNPKGEHVGFRAEMALLAKIDAEVDRRGQLAGVKLNRSQVLRAMVIEALTPRR